MTLAGSVAAPATTAASKLVEAMVAGGYLTRGADPRDGRQRPVYLTARGRELLRSVERIYAELEAEATAGPRGQFGL